jgi:hypothetical protein
VLGGCPAGGSAATGSIGPLALALWSPLCRRRSSSQRWRGQGKPPPHGFLLSPGVHAIIGGQTENWSVAVPCCRGIPARVSQ